MKFSEYQKIIQEIDNLIISDEINKIQKRRLIVLKKNIENAQNEDELKKALSGLSRILEKGAKIYSIGRLLKITWDWKDSVWDWIRHLF